ncbi:MULTISPECIES: hypothetical protein [unclassified Moorena]|nr:MULTISPECIES: hypothetical protein [unclassified Moorena]
MMTWVTNSIPDSRFPIPDSRLPTPYSLPTHNLFATWKPTR